MTDLLAPSAEPKKKSRSILLPVLIVLFLLSYSLLTALVVFQGRTIESQRALLREMLKDSNQLADLKVKIAREQAAKQAQAPVPQAPPEQKDPVVNKAPKSAEKDTRPQGKTTRSLKSVPGKPAADLEDVRRSTRVL